MLKCRNVVHVHVYMSILLGANEAADFEMARACYLDNKFRKSYAQHIVYACICINQNINPIFFFEAMISITSSMLHYHSRMKPYVKFEKVCRKKFTATVQYYMCVYNQITTSLCADSIFKIPITTFCTHFNSMVSAS